MKRTLLVGVLLGSSGAAQSPPCIAQSPWHAIRDGYTFRPFVMADLDGDGYRDLSTVGIYPSAINKWRAIGNGQFELRMAVQPPNLPLAAYTSLASGDVDRDGDQDLLVTRSTGLQNPGLPSLLLLNDGLGNFTPDVQGRIPAANDKSFVAVLFDADGDRDLDAFIGNQPTQNRLYLNDGRGFFTDATNTHMPGDNFTTTAAVAADADGDGDLDLFVANGREPGLAEQNALYVNDGSGRFFYRLFSRGEWTRAVAVADIDGDRDLDVAFANFGLRTELYVNDGQGNFSDVSHRLPDRAHVPNEFADWVDLEVDGDMDLVLAGPGNGTSFRFLLNDGQGNFTLLPTCVPVSPWGWHGMVAGDVDADGDVDLLTSRHELPTWHAGVLLHLHRQIYAPLPPRLGQTFRVDLHGTSGHLFYLALALGVSDAWYPPYGRWHLDPATTIVLPPVPIPPGRLHTVSLQIPNLPPLRGRTLYAQAIDADFSRFELTRITNWLSEVMQ